jgi:hypothetical protein
LFSYTVADVGTNPTNLPDYSTLAKSYEIFSPSNSNNYSTATLSFKSASAPASIQDTVYHAPGVFMSLYQSKTIAVGEAVYAIAIPTVGTAPFTYQWYKNGAQIPGGTEAALIINNAQLSDSGGYHVVVTRKASLWRSGSR